MKKNNAGDNIILDFKLYYRAIVTKSTQNGMDKEIDM
jgi:hypothetical protein